MTDHKSTKDLKQLILKLQNMLRKVKFMQSVNFPIPQDNDTYQKSEDIIEIGIKQLDAFKVYQGIMNVINNPEIGDDTLFFIQSSIQKIYPEILPIVSSYYNDRNLVDKIMKYSV